MDFWPEVQNLGVKHRVKDATRALMKAGTAATPALRRGLRHPNPDVRVGCEIVLDHFLDEAAVPELLANLQHEDSRVRQWAMHALVCDRCKEGECRPEEADTVPLAMKMLTDDPSREVRVQAVHLLGVGHALKPEVAIALEEARDNDTDPNVRKVARRYTPGGSIYRRLLGLPAASARRPLPRNGLGRKGKATVE